MYVHLCTYIQLVAYIHTICCIPHSYLHCMLPRVFELALPVLFNPVTVHTMGLSSPLLGNVVVSGPYYHKEAVVTPYIYIPHFTYTIVYLQDTFLEVELLGRSLGYVDL